MLTSGLACKHKSSLQRSVGRGWRRGCEAPPTGLCTAGRTNQTRSYCTVLNMWKHWPLTELLEDHMDFPPQSPDLSLIQHLWEHLKSDKAEHSVTPQETLWNAVETCCDKVFAQTCGVCASSVHVVINGKWRNTKIFWNTCSFFQRLNFSLKLLSWFDHS